MLFDIGVNLTSSQFRNDREAVVQRARQAGVSHIMVTATSIDTSLAAIELGEKYDLICTAGVHPHDAADVPIDWLTQLQALAVRDQVRAIGETGLDFNRNFSPRDVQIDIFCAQIALAQQTVQPLFVHDRGSDGEVLRHLQSAGVLPPTIIHCFTGSRIDLDRYLAEGFYIGITGWITDLKRGQELRSLVRQVPLNRLLLETDAPFLRPTNTPEAFRTTHQLGSKYKRRNEPALLTYVLDVVAENRNEDRNEILKATTENATRLFGRSTTGVRDETLI
jgi:TatD DNase family protein